MAFTHLHVHTEYSLLDGSNKIKEYIKRVKELGMTHAAITDHGTMYGCVAFYEEAKKQGIWDKLSANAKGFIEGLATPVAASAGGTTSFFTKVGATSLAHASSVCSLKT